MKTLLTPNACKLADALIAGPVRAIGGVVYHPKDFAFMMTTTHLRESIAELGRHGVKVCRTDAGGSPTWDVTD